MMIIHSFSENVDKPVDFSVWTIHCPCHSSIYIACTWQYRINNEHMLVVSYLYAVMTSNWKDRRAGRM